MPVAHSCAGVPGASFGGECARLAALKALQGAQLSAASTRRAARLLRKRVGSPIASACGSFVASVLRGGLVLLQCSKRVACTLFSPWGQWSLLKAVTARGVAVLLFALGVPWAAAHSMVWLARGTAAGVYNLCSGAHCSYSAALLWCPEHTCTLCATDSQLFLQRHSLSGGPPRLA